MTRYQLDPYVNQLIESALAIQDEWHPELYDTDNPTEMVPIPASLLEALQDAVDDFVRETERLI